MSHKLLTLINIIRLYRTWPLVILDEMRLLKNGAIEHALRNGTRYLTRAKVEDIGKINSIYIERQYNKHLDKIQDNSVVIDIGAHIGVFSIFAQKSAKDVSVYSYEPFDENFDLLKQNIELNNLGKDIHAFNLGISSKRGLRQLFLHKANPGASSMFDKTTDFVQVETITLKDVFDENGITRCDFLKMDCEGAEYEILFNTPGEYMDKIKSISMEYHDDKNLAGLIKFLEDNGFGVAFKKGKDHLLYAEKVRRPYD